MKFAQTLAIGAMLLGGGAALAQTAAPAQPGASAPSATPSARPERVPGGRIFAMFDTNSDGRVTWDEAWAVITTRFNAADADRSGGLTVQEFAQLRRVRPEGQAPRHQGGERMEQMRGVMFRSLDANRDGVVTLAEIEPFAQARFRGLDANGDGAVTREEMPRPPRHHHGHHRHGDRPAPTDAPAQPAR
ncbi:EF-hand domain-containing protein [Roseococcus sp. YIM B11640]|uniref:EF-hand domain-containing protein n=1 Tax=Roseococcus sp. YIM B11640 TaxID=3133973 RepID=UPI003C7A65DF